MSNLEDITEHLLNRAQEAVTQLEVWISDQQNFQKSRSHDANEELKDMYSLYVAQLNSLCVRSEYVINKLNKEQRRRSSQYRNHKYIEDLVFEFQDITLKLNDIAVSQNKNTTPSSKSSKSSCDSFQPKPLKITERHRSYMEAAQRSPIKKENSKKKVVVISDLPETDPSSSRCLSLPGSPLKESRDKTIRLAKSYDTGLNRRSISKRTPGDKKDVKSFFKDNQRLSISLFEDCDKEDDSMSDQDTVISVSPACEEKFVPLRRYNSHESILSIKKPRGPPKKLFSSFLPNRSNCPSMNSARISSAPVFSKASNPARSRDLLCAFVKDSRNAPLAHEVYDRKKSSSFFAKWNPFNLKPVISNTTTVANHKAKHRSDVIALQEDGTRHEFIASPPRKLNRAISAVPREPIFDSTIAYEDLRDALNTELII